MSLIALLDCNNFFVSCERLFRPDLVDKPVVVLSSNDGCVVARSKEIKDKGIPMGVPYFQIKDILQEIGAVHSSSNFTLYRDISRRVFDIVVREFPEMEQYSIDEAFFKVSEKFDEHDLIAFKRQIEKEVGIPVSLALAASKTRAKYANTIAKKTNTVVCLDENKWQEVYQSISLNQIWGVGKGRMDQFNRYNLKTVKDFLELENRDVSKWFGTDGLKLYAELNGKVAIPIECKREPQKSIMSTRSFAASTTNIDDIAAALKYHIYQVAHDLHNMQRMARRLVVMISPSNYGDYFLHGRKMEVLLDRPTADLLTLQKEALKALELIYQADIPYKKAGVLLADLVDVTTETQSLFAWQQPGVKTDNNKLNQSIYQLNKRYGKSIINLGFATTKKALWHEKKENLSPSYTTKWTDIKRVIA